MLSRFAALSVSLTQNASLLQLCGGLGEWMYSSLAGIVPTGPGYSRVRIAPQISKTVGPDSVNASVHTVRGVVRSEWVRLRTAANAEADAGVLVSLKVTVPIGATATVHLPTLGVAADAVEVFEGDDKCERAHDWLWHGAALEELPHGVQDMRRVADARGEAVVATVASGVYCFCVVAASGHVEDLSRSHLQIKADDTELVDKYLFVNRSTLASIGGARLVLNRPRKAETPVIVSDRSWESWAVFAENAPIRWNSTHYRLYYECAYGMETPSLSWIHDAICLAESTDGRMWTKPVLGIAEFQGSKQNNIVLPLTMNQTFELGNVFRDDAPGTPDSERWKMTVIPPPSTVSQFAGLHPVNKGAVGWYTMTSAADDGVSWRLLHNHSWVDDSDTQVVTTGYNKALQKYVSYIRINEPSGPELPCRDDNSLRRIGMCVSSSLEYLCGPQALPSANAYSPMGATTSVFQADDADPNLSLAHKPAQQVVDVYTNAA